MADPTYIDVGNDGGHNGAPTATWTITTPSDTAVDDYFIFFLSVQVQATSFTLNSTPSGSVQLIAPNGTTSQTIAFALYGWKATSSGAQTRTFVFSTAYEGSFSWMRVRNVDTTTPWSVNPAATAAYNNATSHVAPTVTTAHANTFVVGGVAVNSSSAVFTATGWTMRQHAPDRIGLLATKGIQASAGATGTATFTSGSTLWGKAWQGALKGTSTTPPSETFSLAGHVTDTTFRAAVKTANSTSNRLKVGTNSAVTTGTIFGSAGTPDGSSWCKSDVTGMTANTQYWYQWEYTDSVGATSLGTIYGPFKTASTVGAVANTKIVFGSCHDTSSATGTAYTNAYARTPDLFFHLGDFHYADRTDTTQANHLADLEAQLTANSALKTLMANVPTYAIKSDHDAGGGDNALPGSYTAPNRAAHKQMFPHPDLSDTNALYWSIVRGRVKIIFTDCRYLRTAAPSGTKLGSTQKQWLKDQLVTSEPFKIIVFDNVFNISDSPVGEDKWSDYPTEQDEIGDYIRDVAVGTVEIITGDQHALSADNGSNNAWGIPSVCAAPFVKTASHKGGPWSEGRYPTSTGGAVNQYGVLDITDNTTYISCVFTGYDTTNTSRVTLTVNANIPVTPSFISGASTVHSPTANVKINAAPNFISAASTVHNPTVLPQTFVAPAFISAASTIQNPTVVQNIPVAPGFVSAAAQVFSPDVQININAAPAFITAGSSVFNPTLGGMLAVAPGFVSSVMQVFDPSLIQNTGASPDHISVASQIFDPSIYLSIDLEPDFISSVSQVFAPSTGGQTLVAPTFIPVDSEVAEPTILTTLNVVPNLVGSVSNIFNPALTGSVNVVPNRIESTSGVFNPRIGDEVVVQSKVFIFANGGFGFKNIPVMFPSRLDRRIRYPYY